MVARVERSVLYSNDRRQTAVRRVSAIESRGRTSTCRSRSPVLDGDARAGDRGLGGGDVLEREQTWKSGLRAQVALRLQLLDQLLEREVLVGEGAEGRLPHPRQQLAEAGLAGEVGAQDQGVDEEADQPLDLGRVRLATGVPTTTSSWPV